MPCPVCAKCRREMYPKQNGVGVELLASFGSYQLWSGDLWACGCGAEVIVGFGKHPIREHFEPDYAVMVRSFEPTYKVRDA